VVCGTEPWWKVTKVRNEVTKSGLLSDVIYADCRIVLQNSHSTQISLIVTYC